MDPVPDSGPWTLSKEWVYGPLVQVSSPPVLNGSLLTPSFSLNSLFLHFHSARQFGCLANFCMGAFSRTGTNDSLYNLRDWSHHFVFSALYLLLFSPPRFEKMYVKFKHEMLYCA